MTLIDSSRQQLLEALSDAGGGELIRECVRLVLQELIEAEAAEAIGAARYERRPERRTERNGYRPRLGATQGRWHGLEYAQAAQGQFLSFGTGTPQAGRPSLVRGGGGLRVGGVHPFGG